MSRAKVEVTCQPALSGGATDLAQLGTNLLTLSLQSANEFIKRSSAFWLAALPAVAATPSADCCEIPETGCPPRCVCKIDWEAARGEHLRAAIHVTNRSEHARIFTFSAKPFASGDQAVIAPALTPTTAQLQSGQSVAVTVELTLSDTFQPGASYSTEVLIVGAYEQCVCLTLKVEQECVCHCQVEQGDPPVRVKAHQWYDHFQCSELCSPTRTPGTVVTPVTQVPISTNLTQTKIS
jgi:hypothetical protein